MRHGRPGQSEPGNANPAKAMMDAIYPSPEGKFNRATPTLRPGPPPDVDPRRTPLRDDREDSSEKSRTPGSTGLSVHRRTRTRALDLAPTSLGVHPSPLRGPAGPTAATLRRRRRDRLLQKTGHPLPGLHPVARLGTVALRRHRQHPVDQPPFETFQGPGPASGPQGPAGGHVQGQRHPGVGGVDVLSARPRGPGETPPQLVGGNGHRPHGQTLRGLVASRHRSRPSPTRAGRAPDGPQCAASCQFCPLPTETPSGTRRS